MNLKKVLLIVMALAAFKGVCQDTVAMLKLNNLLNVSALENSLLIESYEEPLEIETSLLENPMEVFELETSLLNDTNLCENNRWEGVDDIQVGANFKLLAFHACRPNSYSSTDNLKIAFYQRKNIASLIEAKAIQNSSYRMIVKENNWSSGWQTFDPWHVKEKLDPYGVKANNLGVLIRDVNKIILPAYILKNAETRPAFSDYKVYFKTPDYIKKLEYRIFNMAGEQVGETGVIEEEEEGSSFFLKLKLPPNAEAGLYTLKLRITWESNQTQEPKYIFNHAK